MKDAFSALDYLLPGRWAAQDHWVHALKPLMRRELKSVRIRILTLFKLILTAPIRRLAKTVWALPFWHSFLLRF